MNRDGSILNPCPWCGADRGIQIRHLKRSAYVCCTNCGASGPSCEHPPGKEPQGYEEPAAIAAWNRVARVAAPPAPSGVTDALTQAIRALGSAREMLGVFEDNGGHDGLRGEGYRATLDQIDDAVTGARAALEAGLAGAAEDATDRERATKFITRYRDCFPDVLGQWPAGHPLPDFPGIITRLGLVEALTKAFRAVRESATREPGR